MARSVYKICDCKDQTKCRHPWWFSFKQRGVDRRFRKSLDVIVGKHLDSKTVAEDEAERIRIAIVDGKLTTHQAKLLGIETSTPVLETLTISQLLNTYHERHLSRTATSDKRKYEIGAIMRTSLPRIDGTSAALGEWLVTDVTADTLERLRESSGVRTVHKSGEKRTNIVGGRSPQTGISDCYGRRLIGRSTRGSSSVRPSSVATEQR